VPEKFYNLSRTEAFYQHKSDELALIPVFAAFVAPGASVKLSAEQRPRGVAQRPGRGGAVCPGLESGEQWTTFCQ